MNIKSAIESLDYITKAEVTPFFWGHAGIGKSSIVKQWAVKNGFKFFPFYLGTQSDLGDILGLADFVRDESGNPVATTFAIPKWLKDTVDYCHANPDSGAVIFLDEFNRARRDILNGMFSLALDKTFHTLTLPKNCHVIAAGNPPTDEYFTTDVDETALMARFVHIKLEPTVEEWVEYARETKIEPNLIEFIRQQPELLEDKRSDFKLPIKVDRRAFSRLNKLMQLGTPEHLITELMVGIIGLDRTIAYQQFNKAQDKPLTALEVLSGDKDSVEKFEKWSNPTNIMGSLLNLTVENVVSHFNGLAATDLLTDKQKTALMVFFETIPKDIVFSSLTTLTRSESVPFRDFTLAKDHMKRLTGIVNAAQGKVA